MCQAEHSHKETNMTAFTSALDAFAAIFHEAWEASAENIALYHEVRSERYAEAGTGAAFSGYSDPGNWANEAVRGMGAAPRDEFAGEAAIVASYRGPNFTVADDAETEVFF
jgi:hypothetical protein